MQKKYFTLSARCKARYTIVPTKQKHTIHA